MPLFHIHGLIAAVLSALPRRLDRLRPGLRRVPFFRWFAESNPTWYTAVPTMHQAILGPRGAQPRDHRGGRLR